MTDDKIFRSTDKALASPCMQKSTSTPYIHARARSRAQNNSSAGGTSRCIYISTLLTSGRLQPHTRTLYFLHTPESNADKNAQSRTYPLFMYQGYTDLYTAVYCYRRKWELKPGPVALLTGFYQVKKPILTQNLLTKSSINGTQTSCLSQSAQIHTPPSQAYANTHYT